MAQQISVNCPMMKVKAPALSSPCTMMLNKIGAALLYTKEKEGMTTASAMRGNA